jgi:hypothetical protein
MSPQARPTVVSCLLAASLLACTLIPGKDPARARTLLLWTAVVPLLYLASRAASAMEGLAKRARGAAAVFWSLPLPLFLAGLFALELALAASVSILAFERIPHVHDSVAQLFHARILARGELIAPSPPLPQFFWHEHVILAGGRWYSQYPPGHIVLLTLGVLLGAPWLVNPLLGALTVVTLYFVGRELWDDTTGRLCAVLGVLSPFVLFMSSEFMNHASALLGSVLFMLFFARALRLASVRSGLGAGLALGFVAMTRPFSAAGVALPFAAFALSRLIRTPRTLAAPLLAMCAGASLMLGLLLAFNSSTNGSPLVFGYHVLYGRAHDPGFGHSGWGEPHTPALGWLNSAENLVGLNQYLFEWPFPSLLFVAALFALRAHDRWDTLLLASGASLAVFHFFYWYQDLCFGPRFLYEGCVTWLALTARGLLATIAWAEATPAPRLRGQRRMFLVALLAVGWGYAFAVAIPARAREYAHAYWGVDRAVLNAVERQGIREGLVFVDSEYRAVLAANSPWLDQPLIFARDRGLRNQRLMRLFPNATAWLERDGVLVRHPAIEPAARATRPAASPPDPRARP